MAHPLGKVVPRIEKCALGGGLIILIMLLIGGPILLFSSLNPASVQNPPTQAFLSFGLSIYNPISASTSNIDLYYSDELTRLL
jgi:hypothetical protein